MHLAINFGLMSLPHALLALGILIAASMHRHRIGPAAERLQVGASIMLACTILSFVLTVTQFQFMNNLFNSPFRILLPFLGIGLSWVSIAGIAVIASAAFLPRPNTQP